MKAKGRSRSRTETREPRIVRKKVGVYLGKVEEFYTRLSSCGEKVSEFNKVFCICANKSIGKLQSKRI